MDFPQASSEEKYRPTVARIYLNAHSYHWHQMRGQPPAGVELFAIVKADGCEDGAVFMSEGSQGAVL